MLCGQDGWRLNSSISERHIGANRFADGVAKALPSGALFLLEHDRDLGPHKHFGFLSLLLQNEVPDFSQVQAFYTLCARDALIWERWLSWFR